MDRKSKRQTEKRTDFFPVNSASSKTCMYTNCLQDAVSESGTKELFGPGTSRLLPVPSGLLSCHQHTRHFSIRHIAIDKKRRATKKTVTKGPNNMLQLCLQAMLCTVCLHAHGIMQDTFISFHFFFFDYMSNRCLSVHKDSSFFYLYYCGLA